MTHVIVVGAGIIGLATARELALRGARVTVLDRDMAAAGTSSRGEGNMLVSDKEIPAEAALALRSLQLWASFAAGSREAFEYESKGGLITAASEVQLDLLAAQADRQQALGISSTVVRGDALRALEPGLSPALVGGIHYPQDAQVMPIHAVRALARSAQDLGVRVRTRTVVTGLVRRDRGIRLLTSDGHVDGAAVVNAAGPWAADVARVCGGLAPVFPRRGLLLVTEPLPAGTVRHKVYDGSYVEAVSSDEAAAQVAVVVESTASGTVLIGSTREAVGWATDVRWDLAGRLARLAVELFPALAVASVIRTYQGFRPATPDHLPLIGPDALVEGLYHHTGHEGAGIGLALGSAELLAESVLHGVTDVAFDPRRFTAAVATPVAAPDSAIRTYPVVCRPASAEGSQPDTPGVGQAVSAATTMLVSGQQAWRRTRLEDRPRGLFCGIGHCWDCAVTDAHGRTVRACLTPAADLAGGVA